ncbi:MAG: hypothetical protein HW386_1197 [Gammaproteobacteria bacterium]|nr:hypothetical protein [Gammaproteobacteria bacterium]
MRVKQWLREPILHFILIGFALFLYHHYTARDSGDERRIVVSQAEIDNLARQYQATWMRPPTVTELSGLVETYIQDEIMYREGRALGLDRDDSVIKRRVRQKLEVLSEEVIERAPPGDADLAEYLQANPYKFRQPAVVSFEQILLTTEGSGVAIDRRLAAVRSAIEHGADPATLGIATMLPYREEGTAVDLVARSFGEQFAAQLETLEVGKWAGPVVSGFGMHLVWISARTPAELPLLAEVRPLVEREWEADRRARALAAEYRRLREQYDVVIEAKSPETAPRQDTQP